MITADSAADAKVRLDGVPGELPGAWTSLKTQISGKRGSSSAECALAYDDDNLYVAMKVADKKIVRTAAAGNTEDHAKLYLAFPTAKGALHTYAIGLFPGDPGKLPGLVKLDGRNVAGAELVEAPEEGGLTFEAKIPWKTFAEAARTRVGMRAGMVWTDAVAPGRIGSIVATTPNKEGKDLPLLLTEPEQAVFDGLIRAQSLTVEPQRELYVDVAGDRLNERVAIFDHFLTVMGPHFRGGREFVVADLQVPDASKIKRLQSADFDGDGHDEIITVVRMGSDDHYRDVLEVLRIDADNSIKPIFLHEIGLTVGSDGVITNELKIGRAANRATLTIAQGSADNVERASYSEPKPSDMDGALLPWDTVGSKTFGWQSGRLAKLSETSHTPVDQGTARRGGPRKHEASAAASVASPPPPRPPSTDELLDQVYALYRKDRNVKKGQPRFDFVTDVAGDTTNERVLVHDKDIVCFGKGFREGTSYAYTSVGVASPDDILDVTARDLTGDGKAEVIVLAALHAKAGKELDDAEVERAVMFVFQVKETGIRRIFAAETARSIGNKVVLSGLRFLPQSTGVTLQLAAGRAVGFTANSYPFPDETEAAGGLEPVVLPWSKKSVRTYRFNGERFSAQ